MFVFFEIFGLPTVFKKPSFVKIFSRKMEIFKNSELENRFQLYKIIFTKVLKNFRARVEKDGGFFWQSPCASNERRFVFAVFVFFSRKKFMREYLRETYFLDFTNEAVRAFAEANSSENLSPKQNAVRLYYAVRDGFKYNPYVLDLRKEGLKASSLLKKNNGYCIEKALLLAAAARSIEIPSRLSFYIVSNHIATGRIEKILKTKKLVFHGAAELYLGGRWLKATPAFDRRLCLRLGVAPLEFDGTEDAVFQQFDDSGNHFMEYLHSYGEFSDMPYDLALSEFIKHYPHVFASKEFLRGELIFDLSMSK